MLHFLILLQLIQLTVALVPLPTLQFETSAITVNEGDNASICITADRQSPSTYTAAVNINGITADINVDFIANSQSMVEFNNVLTKCITIPIHTDTEKESDETFNLVIQPSGSYIVGSNSIITVTIKDVSECNCKERIVAMACKKLETEGEQLPMPCLKYTS